MKELSSLNPYLAKYKYRILFGVIFIALSNWFGVFPAQIIRLAFDLVKDNLANYQLTKGFENQAILKSIIIQIALLFGALIVLIAIIKGVFMFFMRQTIIVVSRLIEFDLKNVIYQKYQELSLSFYRVNNTGDLMNRVSEDVSRVRMYIGPAIMYTLNLIVLFVLVISTMISVNPMLTFYALLPLPLLFVAIYYVQNTINTKSENIQAQLSILTTTVQETFSGIRIIKAFGREKQLADRFATDSEVYKTKSMELVKVQAIFFPTILGLIGISTLLTVYFGGKEVINGSITAGNIAEFIVYVNILTWPVASVGWVTSLVQRAAASQKRINEFLDIAPEITNPSAIPFEFTNSIEFKNVSFTYPETNITAIDQLSFTLFKGQTLAIVGKTGSGKSTISNLISRMIDVSSGSILIDNQDIKNINLNDWRNQIGIVPQEVFLFSDSIQNNITFGKDACDIADIHQAAQMAGVYDSIIAFPNGFDTLLGERGITLSGGQKQRVSIARAFIKKPRLLLFDDALSAVDTQTEERILSNLASTRKDATNILISHRISTLKNADMILYLAKGKVAEMGSHETLLANKGPYYELYQMQLLADKQKQE
ncbi:MAG: ABC transporter ATP-binding protein [Sphingobacteriaceae bacterium]